MNNNTSIQGSETESSGSEQEQYAVPYVPPPPPQAPERKGFHSPYMNGILVAAVILLTGFMAYNYVGAQLTQLAGDSVTPAEQVTPSISPTPSVTP